MKKKDKRVKRERLPEENILYQIEGMSFDSIVEYIKSIMSKYPDYFTFTFEVAYEFEYTSLEVYADRYETDEEVAKREKKNRQSKASWKKRKAKRELEDKLLLKKLKEKYENNERHAKNRKCK